MRLAAFLLPVAVSMHAVASPSASELLQITEQCTPLPGVGRFKTDQDSPTADVQLCQHKNVIWFKADLDVDCDGGTAAACKADKYYDPETSCVTSTGKPLDASSLPYFVLPINSNGFKTSDYGIKCGTIGAVIYNNKVEYAILGDRGPKKVIGEASYALAQRLGINPDPNSGGTGSGVTYIVFTGGGSVLSSPIESHARAVSLGEKLARDLIGSPSRQVTIQKPSAGQNFSTRDNITFSGTATSTIKTVKLLADNRWPLGQTSPMEGKWSLTQRFLNAGDRQIKAIALDGNGKEIDHANVILRIN